MTILTLGTASAGYVYLQQTPAAGEPYKSTATARPSFDWKLASITNCGTNRLPVKDFVNRIHEQTRSVLDDFANQHGGHSDAPVDDAFQRLRQVTQSVVTSTSNSPNSSLRDVASNPKPPRVPAPNLDELQRTAFDPAAVEEPQLNQAIGGDASGRSVNQRDETRESFRKTATVLAQSSDQISKPNQTQDPASLVKTDDPAVLAQSAIKDSNPVTTEPLKRTAAKTTSNRNPKYVAAEWKVVGKTTEGRPMHSMHLGDTGTRTLVIAGLNGDDRTGVRWLELLSEELRRRPELLTNNEVVFFRAGNPDGLTRNVRNNARGVPLNRNFPSRRYRPTPDMPGFAVPAGEVETRVMLDTLYSFRPRRVIHLSAISGRSQVLYNRAAKKIASEFERSTKLSTQLFDSEQFPGSLEDFADGTLEAAVLSMRLSAENDWQKAWTKIQLQVLSAVVGQSVESTGNGADQQQNPDWTPIPPAKEESVRRNTVRKGYEELPAPPLP